MSNFYIAARTNDAELADSDWDNFERGAVRPFVVHVSGGIPTLWESRPPYPAWLTDVEAQVRRLWLDHPGTSDPRADALSPMALRGALEILDDVASPDTLPPALVPTPTGGIQMEWHRNDIDVEIYVDARGLVSSWVREGIREWEADRYSPARLSKELSRITYDTVDAE